MSYHFDLMVPEIAYLFGFLQTDGSLSKSTRNRGKMRVEIQIGDLQLLETFQDLLPVYSSITTRERDTNFKKHSKTAIWTFCDRDLRESLVTLGLPYGKKSEIVTAPIVPFSKRDYFRGVLDGDGSLGITARGYPFLSWCTKSYNWSRDILNFIAQTTGKKKTCNPNSRDNAYNITSFREEAQVLALELYYDNCLALQRKWLKSRDVLAWVRPETMKKVTWERKKWTSVEDKYILQNPVQDSVATLGRTEKSIRVRLSRIRKMKITTIERRLLPVANIKGME